MTEPKHLNPSQNRLEHLPSLAGHQAVGLVPGCPIAQYEIGSYKNFIYLILDWDQKQAAYVDPQADLSLPLQDLKAHGFHLSWILLTHTHFDHVAGVSQLLRQSDAKLGVNALDLHRLIEQKILEPNHPRLSLLQDQQTLSLGALEIQVLHTPGHSAGECCYFIDQQAGLPAPFILGGDTLFIRDCGRTDFEDGSDEQMFHSLQRIKKLPANTVVLPGHHYQPECASTLERELQTSPPFLAKTIQELAAL